MTDPKLIDSLTQLKLTKAILKAASVALVSDKDRSQIIADQLDKDSVPKSLTKIATQAFNRRIAVATIGSRPDLEKAEDFPLADIDKVAALRGVLYMQKAASVTESPFSFVLHTPQSATMKKAASAEKEFPRMSWEQLQTKILNYLLKQAAYIDKYNLQLMSDLGDTQLLVKKASLKLQNDHKAKQQLFNVYEGAFAAVFPLCAKGMTKTAAYTILPDNDTIKLAETAIVQSAVLLDKKEHFVKTAKLLEKVVLSANKIQLAIYDGILHKKADGYSLVKDIAGNAISAPVIAGLGFGTGAATQTADTLRDAASAMFSKDYAVKPTSVITAKLINTDKYDDTKMALIKMLANKNFKAYKAKDIAKATLSEIANNPNFLSPKYNKALTAFVGNNLVNQGKLNLASLAALANILKSLSLAAKASDDVSILNKLKSLSDVKARQDIDLPSFRAVGLSANALSKLLLPYDFGKDLDLYRKQRQTDLAAVLKAMDLQLRREALQAAKTADLLKKRTDKAIASMVDKAVRLNSSHHKDVLQIRGKGGKVITLDDPRKLSYDRYSRMWDKMLGLFNNLSPQLQLKRRVIALQAAPKKNKSKS